MSTFDLRKRIRSASAIGRRLCRFRKSQLATKFLMSKYNRLYCICRKFLKSLKRLFSKDFWEICTASVVGRWMCRKRSKNSARHSIYYRKRQTSRRLRNVLRDRPPASLKAGFKKSARKVCKNQLNLLKKATKKPTFEKFPAWSAASCTENANPWLSTTFCW